MRQLGGYWGIILFLEYLMTRSKIILAGLGIAIAVPAIAQMADRGDRRAEPVTRAQLETRI